MKEDNKIELLMHSKHLVHTKYEITAIQNRVFYYCLLKAQKEKNGNLKCTVSLQELKKLINNRNNKTLSNIKKIMEVLRESSLEFEDKDPTDNDTIECAYTLISASKYYKNKEIFEITFLEDLYNHIIKYKVYAPLDMDIITRFKSFYAQRLYELLRLWSRTNEVVVKEFKLEQLKFIFGVENKYPKYRNFKQKVLNQALKEINAVGNMEVEIEEIKKLKNTDSVRFTILDRCERKVSELKKSKIEDDSFGLITNLDAKATNCEIAITTNKEFYTPNKKLFTAKTLQLFQEDFSEYDFKDKDNQIKFYEATGITMAKDQENNIKVKSYNYFKTVLLDKLNEKDNVQEFKYKKTKFHNFDETFTQYSDQEFEEIILKSQNEKYK